MGRKKDGKKRGEVPVALRERVLIDDSDRELLRAMDDLSPSNNSVIYITSSIFNRQVPTLKQISDKVGKSKEDVWKQLNKIRKVWNIPEVSKLPSNNGFFDNEDSLVNALTNQHRLRWDEAREDYRVPKFHLMSAEMGLGQLYTNNKAFEGERIFRKATGLDEKLNSVHFQGGIMPEMIQLFGKAKNQRALMTGLNKSGDVDKEAELKSIKQTLELGEHELTSRDMDNLQNYVVNTLGSFEEAAKSVAYEILPLVENLPEHVPVHMYWSYNDIANMSEIEDTLNASLRKIHNKMAKATKDLPKMREQQQELRDKISKGLVDKLVLERVYFHTNKERSNNRGDFVYEGDGFGKFIDSYFHTSKGKDTAAFKKLKKKVRSEYEKITGKEIKNKASEERFDSEFFGVVNDIYDKYLSFESLQIAHEKGQADFSKVHSRISSLEDKIYEAERFENALMAESEGPAWFTGHIAITPMESKALQMVKKNNYKKFYTDILIPKVKELAGKDLNIKLHTDSIITVNVPDPQDLIEERELGGDAPIGTLFTSFPRTNEQRSNEPLLNSAAELQGFHQGEISERIKEGKRKPETVGEFSKRDFASSDVYFSSWGADGFMHQSRFTIGPTTIRGEYRFNPEIANYLKLTTRHDTKKLGELMVKGNRGTWHAKRLAKGGATTGNVIYIEHADQSFQPVFIDDSTYKKITSKYGKKYSALESALLKAEKEIGLTKDDEKKELYGRRISKIGEKLESFNEQIKPELYNILLQNDLHYGGFTSPGRPSLTDRIHSSQLIAAQTFGVDGLQYSIMTEAFNGEQAWRSYDSKREGGDGSKKSDVELMKDLNFIGAKMRERGFGEEKIMEYTQTYLKEVLESKPSFLPETQIALFEQVSKPINEELMNNGMKLYVGSGNHWMASKKGNINEGDVICNLFDKRYLNQGLLIKGRECSGQSYSHETVRLPSVNGKGIGAVVTHKLPSGKTEISAIASHLIRNRSSAKYCFTADRHHPGIAAEKGKMIVMDNGKQPVVQYVDIIGKVASLGGSMVAQYGADGSDIISARYFVDPVVEKIVGWDHTAGILRECKSFLEEAVGDSSIYAEKKKIDYMHERNKVRFNSVIDKYNKK